MVRFWVFSQPNFTLLFDALSSFLVTYKNGDKKFNSTSRKRMDEVLTKDYLVFEEG